MIMTLRIIKNQLTVCRFENLLLKRTFEQTVIYADIICAAFETINVFTIF